MALLKPFIQHELRNPIWKLEADALAGLLYVETRDTQNRQALFASFNLGNGELNFSDLTTDEKWLIGIAGCFNGVLYLHGYQSAQSPVHKSITAVDGFTGKILWQNYVYSLHHISINGPVAYHTQVQPSKLMLLDARNGATLRPYNPPVDWDLDNEIKVPSVMQNADDELNAWVKGEITGIIYYIEHNNFRIVSLHTSIEDKLNQLLLILQAGVLIYKDILNNNIQKLQPEAFILLQNRLVYIKNRIELKVLNL